MNEQPSKSAEQSPPVLPSSVIVPATYKTSWDDGFGARGWKIDASIGDPNVIASTAETGERIPTSVFVHDVLDHHLCGFPLSGHRNEAAALILLSERTGSNPSKDFKQMIEEDILRGQVNGESLYSFLPEKLQSLIPVSMVRDNKLTIGYLIGQLGTDTLKKLLLEQFFYLGKSRKEEAINNWNSTGLSFSKRKQIGLCIQKLLQQTEALLIDKAPEMIHGNFIISDHACSLEMNHQYGIYLVNI